MAEGVADSETGSGGDSEAEADPETDSDPAAGQTAARGSTRDRLRYLLALSRPRFWLYLAGPVAIGVVYGADDPASLTGVAPLALFGYFLFPANVYLYGVNDVFDADVDAANPKKEEREVRYRGQRFVLAAVVATGAGLLALFPLVDRIAWPWLAGFGLLATAYSAPPARFKTTPGLDSLSNGLYVLPGAAAFAAVAGHHPPLAPLLAGWSWTMAMHTFSAIPDVEPDQRAGIRTTATVLGERGALAYCVILWATAAAVAATYHPLAGVAFATYPAIGVGVGVSSVSVERAYWWFPAINGVVGAAITIWGLVALVPPETLV